ncbi:hypothetical protein ACU5AY_11815 [Rhizobium sp. PAMB 3174]
MVKTRLFSGRTGGAAFQHAGLRRAVHCAADPIAEASKDIARKITAVLTIRGVTIYHRDYPVAPKALPTIAP